MGLKKRALLHPRDLCGEGPSGCRSARRKVNYSCSNVVLCLSPQLQAGARGRRLLLQAPAGLPALSVSVVSHCEVQRLCAGEAAAARSPRPGGGAGAELSTSAHCA